MLHRLATRTGLRVPPGTRRAFATTSRCRDAKSAILENKAESTPQATSEKDSLGVVENEERGLTEAPNRMGVWSRSQRPKAKAMTGPRFEQTDFDLQPQPMAAIQLIHRQPVRWTHDKVVACDGGGGPAGHPRIFINTDKPEISVCNYCGLPYAHEHHREHLESLPATSYPLG